MEARGRRLLGHNEGGCNPKALHKDILFTFFGGIQALDQLKRTEEYRGMEWVAHSGTALAIERNEQIIPWDTDTDIFVVFNHNLNEYQLRQFPKDLETVIINMFQTQNSSVFWKDVEDDTTKGKLGVKLDRKSAAWMDIWILWWDDTHSKLKSSDSWLGEFSEWHDKDFFLPPKRVKWNDYHGISVQLPKKSREAVVMRYGENWRTPDMDMECDQPNGTTINQWMKEIKWKPGMVLSHQFIHEVVDETPQIWYIGMMLVLCCFLRFVFKMFRQFCFRSRRIHDD